MNKQENKQEYCKSCKAIIHLGIDNLYNIDDDYYCYDCWSERIE